MSIDVVNDMSIDVAHDMRVSKTPRIRAFFAMMRSEGIAAPQGDRTEVNPESWTQLKGSYETNF